MSLEVAAIIGLMTLSLIVTIMVTAILLVAAISNRGVGVLRERAGISMGLTTLYVLGYIRFVARDQLDEQTLFLLSLLMIAALAIPQLYFLYLYLTRRW